MIEKRGRGRPASYSLEDREYLAELIREHGIRGARRKSETSVCQGTLTKIAREFGIRLPRGKRPRRAA